MKGKQHAAIGITCGVVAALALNKSSVTNINDGIHIVKSVIECSLGGLLGSLIVDIDSKTSIASKKLSALMTIVIGIFVLMKFLNLSLINGIVDDALTVFNGNLFIIVFGILVILGKMSPHRQFTHKFIGTVAFCLVGFMLFSHYIAIGFIIGYISHILADKTTPAGLKFFDFKLPFMDKNNKFKIHFW